MAVRKGRGSLRGVLRLAPVLGTADSLELGRITDIDLVRRHLNDGAWQSQSGLRPVEIRSYLLWYRPNDYCTR
jgi:hypothetical protein